MLLQAENFNSVEFLERQHHPVELLMHEAWLLQTLSHTYLSVAWSLVAQSDPVKTSQLIESSTSMWKFLC